jgi:hypothetical protein
MAASMSAIVLATRPSLAAPFPCYKMLEAAANERPNEWNANCF